MDDGSLIAWLGKLGKNVGRNCARKNVSFQATPAVVARHDKGQMFVNELIAGTELGIKKVSISITKSTIGMRIEIGDISSSTTS
jgi:hypothetical protein